MRAAGAWCMGVLERRCHMVTVSLVLLIAALVLFGVAIFGPPTRINLVAAGLFCWVLSILIGRIR